MELWRRAANPWGQDVLIGVSWDLMWAAVAAAGLFLVGHALWIRTVEKRRTRERLTFQPASPKRSNVIRSRRAHFTGSCRSRCFFC